MKLKSQTSVPYSAFNLVDDVGLLHEVKGIGSEADHAPPSSAGVKKNWSGTSTHPHTFKATVRKTVIFGRVRKIAKSDNELRHVCPPVCLSVLNQSPPTGRIFMKFVFE